MKPKTIIKIVIDVFMTIGLLFAFGYQFWGKKWHEWMGAGETTRDGSFWLSVCPQWILVWRLHFE